MLEEFYLNKKNTATAGSSSSGSLTTSIFFNASFSAFLFIFSFFSVFLSFAATETVYAEPNAQAECELTLTVEAGDTVLWDSGATGENITITWSGDDGLSGDTATVEHTYDTAGSKTATVLVESDTEANCDISAEIITVDPVYPTVSLTADPSTIQEGNSSELSWSSEDAVQCTSADFDTSDATSGTVTVSPTADITYEIECESETGHTASDSVMVEVTDASSVSQCELTLTVEAGDTVLWDSGATGENITITWSGNDGLSGDTATVEHTYQTGGSKTATVLVESDTEASCDISAEIVTVDPTPDQCQFDPKEGRTIVEFGEFIRADKEESDAIVGPFSVSLAPGIYDISLESYDAHSQKTGQNQNNERWFVELVSNNSLIATTTPISDLPDNKDYLREMVDNGFVVTEDIDELSARHYAFPSSNPESVTALCAAFDKVGEIEVNPTVELTATPDTIDEGDSSELTWSSERAAQCTSDDFDTSDATSGTVTVSPTADTTYEIECESETGHTATDSATVTVDEDTDPALDQCQFDPKEGRTIVEFGEFLLADRTESDATAGPFTVSLSSGIYDVSLESFDGHSSHPGQKQDNEQWFVELLSNGSIVATTTPISDLPDEQNHLREMVDSDFVVTENIDEVSVRHYAFPSSNPESIKPLCAAFDRVGDIEVTPSVTLTADPDTIDEGDSSELTWSSEDAVQCTSDDFNTNNATSGTVTVSPTTDTTYEIECESETGHTASDSATVTVDEDTDPTPTPSVSLMADPDTIDEGDSSELSWSSNNTDTCTSDDFVTNDATTGTTTVTPTTTTTYSIECEGSNGTATDSVTVTVEKDTVDTEGSITICKMITDTEGNVITDSSDLPDGFFAVSLFRSLTLTDRFFTLSLSSDEFQPNTTIFGDSHNAYCETADNLDVPGEYYYPEETLTGEQWLDPRYSDQFDTEVNSLDDLFEFDSELFDLSDEDEQSNTEVMDMMSDIEDQALAYHNAFGSYLFLKSDPSFNGEEYTQAMADQGIASSLEELNDLAPTNVNPVRYIAVDDDDQNWVMISQLYGTDREWCVDSTGVSEYVARHSFNEMRLQENRATLTGPLEDYNCGDFEEAERNKNADGHIILSEDRPDRTLVVLNRFSTSTDEIIPTADLTATPDTIDEGGSTELTWDSEDAVQCTSSDFDTNNATSGTTTVENITSTTTFTIECESETGHTATDSATVTVSSTQPSPSVSLTADPTTIDEGDDSTLTWSSNNTDTCTSDDFVTNDATTGTTTVTPTTTTTYSIECEGSNGTATDSVTVTVDEDDDTTTRRRSSRSSQFVSDRSLVITNETVERAGDGSAAMVEWDTNLDASSQVVYGTESISESDLDESEDRGYDSFTVEFDSDTRDHIVAVTGLEFGETYYFRAISKTDDGKEAVSSELTITAVSGVGGLDQCSYLEDHLHINWDNDPAEVLKLQLFLNGFEDISTPVNGTFDQATYNSVVTFQERYFDDVLAPWSHTAGTGFVYITTKKKINEIVCQRAFPLSAQEESEIAQFSAFLQSLREQGITPPFTPEEQETVDELLEDDQEDQGDQADDEEERDADDIIDGDINELIGENEEVDPIRGQSQLAAVAGMFNLPDTVSETIWVIIVLLLILALLFLLTSLIAGVLADESDTPKDEQARKTLIFTILTAAMTVFAYFTLPDILFLPLVVILIVAIIRTVVQYRQRRKVQPELDL